MAATTRVDDVMAFLTARGFSAAAAALRDDLPSLPLTAGSAGDGIELDGVSSLPPLKLPPPGRARDGGDDGAPKSFASSSTDAFLSMGSPPSELLNPYGVWSPASAKSEASSSDRHSEFGTARNYSYWYDEQFAGYQNDDYLTETNSNYGQYRSEDKFILSTDREESPREQASYVFGVTDYKNEHEDGAVCEGCAEVYTCSFPLCDCCHGTKEQGNADVTNMVKNSSSVIYGRYLILDDHTERLEECGEDDFQLKRRYHQIDSIILEGDLLHERNVVDKKESLVSGLVEKELQMLNLFALEPNACTDLDSASKVNCNRDLHSGEMSSVNKIDFEEPEKEEYNIDNFAERASVASGFGSLMEADKEIENTASHGFKGADGGADEFLISDSFEDELEVFNLRIIHHKNRTGFEENKDFPLILNSVIAGRYYITEYLGSAAFSKVVQAHDLHTGMDVCLKIIKNNKDFFDQSLDEIKLLKLANLYDPADERHLLRLYDYFYHKEHLFIVTELLRANLYEFQKYNQETGGDNYYTLPRLQAIARQCLEALEYLHSLRIIHSDLKPENILIKSYNRCEIKVIDLGSSCFETDTLSLYVQSRSYRAPEVILGLPYDQKIDIWSLGCILAELYTGDVLFPNDSVPMILARMIGILGPIDMEMLELGQETNKYFTSNYDLKCTNEETGQTEYLIPEKSSLSHHLQGTDANFVDFLSFLLQMNPRRRPIASEALQHQWLSLV